MADAAALSAGFALFSGVAVGLVGAVLLALGPRKAHARAFAFFLLLWSGLAVAGNLARLAALDGDAAAADRWVRLYVPMLLVLYLPLALFARRYAAPAGAEAGRREALLLLAPAALGALALLAAPGLVYQGLAGSGAATRSEWGPLQPVFVALFLGSLYLACWAVHRAPPDPARDARQDRAVLAALLLYGAYWAAESLVLYGAALLAGGPAPLAAWRDGVTVAVALGGLAVVGAIARDTLRAPRDAPLRREVLAAAALPALAGLASGAAVVGAGLALPAESLGLWRTLTAVAVAYALLRYELFDLDAQRLFGELATARRALEDERQVLRRFTEVAPTGIFAFDGRGRVTLWNPAMERLTGLPRGRALGKPAGAAVRALGPGAARLLDPARLDGPATLEAGGARRRWLEAHAVPLPSDAGAAPGGFVVLHDVTARRVAEEERRRSEEREREIRRLEELHRLKSEFINHAAHELNTPLTALVMQANILKARAPGLPPQERKSVGILDRNLHRLSDLVQDMLEAARIQAGYLPVRRQPVDLGAVLDDVAEGFQEVSRQRGVALEVKGAKGLRVEADPKRLAQVLYNLVGNAIDFTPAGGRVEVQAAAEGPVAAIRVRDTGVGFDPGEAPRLFQPFVQLPNQAPAPRAGTGLGLYISKGIVEAHGGRIWGESPGAGRGATFGFAVPLAGKDAPMPRALGEAPMQPPAD